MHAGPAPHRPQLCTAGLTALARPSSPPAHPPTAAAPTCAQDLARNSTASLTLHEAQLAGACRGIDPEDPTCAKLTLTGVRAMHCGGPWWAVQCGVLQAREGGRLAAAGSCVTAACIEGTVHLALHTLTQAVACPPVCAGSLEPVPPEQLEEAEALLFPRHPDMRDWPEGHSFRV